MDFIGIAVALLLLLAVMLFGVGAHKPTKHGHDNNKGTQKTTKDARTGRKDIHGNDATTTDDRKDWEDSEGMMTTKLENFLSKPLQDLDIVHMPGVGTATLKKMEDAKHKRKIETVEQLFGYFLYSGDDFEDWLCDTCGVKPHIAKKIVESMKQKADKVCVAGGRGDGSPARTPATDVTPVKGCTTVVIDKFRSTPLQDLKVEDIPFIGPVTAQNMKTTKNITTAEQLLGYFLFLGPRGPSPQVSSESVAGMHEERFKHWLKDECKVTGSVAQKVYRSLVAKADVVCIV